MKKYICIIFILSLFISSNRIVAQVNVKADTISKANMRNSRGVSRLISSSTPYYTILSISNLEGNKGDLYQLLLKIYSSSVYYRTGYQSVSGKGVPLVLVYNKHKTEQQGFLSKEEIKKIPLASIKSIEAICSIRVPAIYGSRAIDGIIEITLDKLHLDNSQANSQVCMRINPTAKVKKRSMSRLNGNLVLSDEEYKTLLESRTEIDKGNLYQMSLKIYSALSYYKTGESGLPANNVPIVAIYNRDKSRFIRMSKEEIEQIPSGSVKSIEIVYGAKHNVIYDKVGIFDSIIEITLDRE